MVFKVNFGLTRGELFDQFKTNTRILIKIHSNDNYRLFEYKK